MRHRHDREHRQDVRGGDGTHPSAAAVGLDDLGLTAALEHCVNEWRSRLSSTSIGLSIGGEIENLDAPAPALFRLVQEALTNIARTPMPPEWTYELRRGAGAPPAGSWRFSSQTTAAEPT